ncbi:MAG: hypothetical protein WD826_04985, partial [Actinomycetota bacterium]
MKTKHICRVVAVLTVMVSLGWSAVASAGTSKAAITVTKTGSGKVTSDPTGLKCGASTNPCVASFGMGKTVKLVATAADGWQFAGWDGDCAAATTRTCKVKVSGPRSVSVTFAKLHKLTVDAKGPGRVVSSPDGISCDKECTAKFRADTDVTLDPRPKDGAILQAWGGACAGQATPT